MAKSKKSAGKAKKTKAAKKPARRKSAPKKKAVAKKSAKKAPPKKKPVKHAVLRGPKGRPGGGDGVDFGDVTFSDPTAVYSTGGGSTSVQGQQLSVGPNPGPFGTNLTAIQVRAVPSPANRPAFQVWSNVYQAPSGQAWASATISIVKNPNPQFQNWVVDVVDATYAPLPPPAPPPR